MYIASQLTKTETDLDEDEFLEASPIPFSELHKMVLSNEITDGKTVLALLKAKEMGLINN